MESLISKLSKERKVMQEEGRLPEWFITAGLQMLSEKYHLNGNYDYNVIADRIATAAAQYMTVKPHWWSEEKTWKGEFYRIIWEGVLSCSTPVLSNMGTTRGSPVSCSGGYIPDSVSGFYSSLKENALLSQEGFGTSSYLGAIRPRGSKIKRGGKASGIMPVLDAHVQMAKDISQGLNRRGSWAGYIPLAHGDFYEVCRELVKRQDDINIGWNVHDEDIAKLQAGDVDMNDRFMEALQAKMQTGKGYFFFPDKVNRRRPQGYVDNNLTVKASNLCVAPNTLILTKDGHKEIQYLAGQEVEIWNGWEWSTVVPRKTGVNQKLLRVVTSSGLELECTEYHKWYVQGNYNSNSVVEKRTHELEPGDKLIKFELPQRKEIGPTNFYHYFGGFYTGDGCKVGNKNRLYFYGEKKKLLPYLLETLEDSNAKIYTQDKQDRIYVDCQHNYEKFSIPDTDFLSWFAGLCDSDGTVARNGTNEALQIGSVNASFLRSVQLRLQEYGVNAKVTEMREAGTHMLPDGRGGSANYACQTNYRLLISSSGLYRLIQAGFKTYRLTFQERLPQRNAEQFNVVVDVIDENQYDDTYCVTEPKRHMAVFNGILTGNCTEITLFADELHTFTCVLSSINLIHWDKLKQVDNEDIFIATCFLEAVAQAFIARAKHIPGLEAAVRFTEKGGALGLGVMGFHSYLQKQSIPFASFEAHMVNNQMFARLEAESTRATMWMGSVYGEREWTKGTGRRNTHCMAVAPTLSTALIMGGASQGIEPVVANVYTQPTSAGEMERINPMLLELMKERGVNNKATIQDIISKKGSVQHVSWLNAHEKDVFKTAFEIDQRAILRLASARQRYIDQAQSINLFFSAEEKEEVIAAIVKEAFLDENCLSLYYFRTESGVLVSNGECEACT